MSKEYDFSKCLIDLNEFKEPSKAPVCDKMELLSFIPGRRSADADPIIAYTVACYDKHSPFNDITNFWERKAACAEYAKFKIVKGGKFSVAYQHILNCTEEWYTNMVIRYCQEIGDMNWTDIVTFTQQYYEIQEIIMKASKAKQDKDVVASIKTKIAITRESAVVKEYLEKAISKMINDDSSLELRDRVFRKASLENAFRPALTPEFFSEE